MTDLNAEREYLRGILRGIDDANAAEAARIRGIIDSVKRLRGQSTGKRRRRSSGGHLPGGVLSPEQIETMELHRSIGLSYGEIAFLMGISKTSAFKYGRDIVG